MSKIPTAMSQFLLSALVIFITTPALGRPSLLTGSIVMENELKTASEIPWTMSLCRAEEQARREGKMVFWIHMLGDIKGAT